MDKMERVSIRRPLNSRKVGDIIDDLGEVVQVYQQGNNDIRVVQIGQFGNKRQILQAAKSSKKKIASKQKLAIAKQTGDKKIIDETQDRTVGSNKKLLRG